MSENVQATNDTQAQQATEQQAAATPTPADMPTQAAKPAEQQPAGIDDLPDWAQKEIRGLRQENAKHRNKAKHAAEEATQREQQHAEEARNALVQDIAKALGLAEDEQDPQQLLDAANEKTAEQQKRIDELLDQVNGYKRAAAVSDAIGARQVNQKLMSALLAQDNAYTQIDVNSDDFAGQVSEVVERVLAENPEIVQVARGQSSVDTSNTNNGQKAITRDDLKTMSAEDINKAVREGRLDHLLKG